MQKFKDITNFLEFCLNYKLPKLVKNKTSQELLDLYCRYAPLYWSKDSSLRNKIVGSIVVFIIGEEFKQRYPNKREIQDWDYREEINLYSIVNCSRR